MRQRPAEQPATDGAPANRAPMERLAQANTGLAKFPPQDVQKLVAQYQASQLELERQNEALRRTCQELDASRERYAQLYNAGTVGYLTLNTADVIQHANPAAALLLGCAKEMLDGKKLGDFIHPDDQEAYRLYTQDLAARHTDRVLTVRLARPKKLPSALTCPGFRLTQCTQQSCNRDYGAVYVECRHAVNFHSGTSHHVCLAVNDISERRLTQESIACLNGKLEARIVKQTQQLTESNLELQNKVAELNRSERRLLEREAKLKAIFNAAVEGIVTLDPGGTIVSANAAIETIFGYPPDALVGTHIGKLIPDGLKEQCPGPQTVPPGSPGIIRTVEGIRRDGSPVPLDVSIAEFSIDGVRHFTSIVRDVSLRKRKEQEDKAHLDELAHVTRLGLMGEMASGIAHEVNQPLTAIAGYTQACLNFMQAEQPDLNKLRDILQKSYQQTLRAGQIIHRMREFVTFKTVHRSRVAVNDLVRVCISLCASDLKHNNIVQRLDLAEHLPAVHADSVQIEQVLLNLIRNSIDALKGMPSKTQRQLSIQTRLDGPRQIMVRVHDNGPGIEEAEQEKILMPFHTTKKSGMGMGLSISQSIIKAHEGALFFESWPGTGTTFYFTLPAQGE